MNSPVRPGSVRAGCYTGISILDEPWGRRPGSSGHMALQAQEPAGTEAQQLKTGGDLEGRPVLAMQASEEEQAQNKINMTVKATAAVQEVALLSTMRTTPMSASSCQRLQKLQSPSLQKSHVLVLADPLFNRDSTL